MRATSVAALGALLTLACASALKPGYVVHQKREVRHQNWERVAKLHPDYVMPMRVGLKQQNLEHGERVLMEVADPASPKFGQHWTAEQVADFFKPSTESVKAVHDWLVSSGIHTSRHKMSEALNWIEFEITAKEAKDMLLADYHLFNHTASGQAQVACDHYSVPAHIQEHLDFITPGVHFDAKTHAPTDDDAEYDGHGNKMEKRSNTVNGWQHKVPHSAIVPQVKIDKADLAGCGGHNVIPDCLRYLYNFDNPKTVHEGNSYGIVEYTPQAYKPKDLDLFFRNFSPALVGQRPIFDSIDGGFLYPSNNPNYAGESDLDLQYSMDLVYPQQVTLYQTGDLQEGASFNNFLDAIDASYCTYQGGDVPYYDGIYPDPYNGSHSYKKPETCGKFAPPKVVSTSYGADEADFPVSYADRQCYEYMKLGLMGTTVLYSSGDNGVAGNGAYCIATNGSYVQGQGRFNPSFPGGCPWVTSVGATQVIPGTDIVKARASGTQPEEACSTIIYSGGGFSNYFNMPTYQSSAVLSWFDDYPAPYTNKQFNKTRKARGFPDISSNGAWWIVAVDGNFDYRWFGTSLSSPTWGSIVTLINNQRLKAGKTSVGFINPTLYSNVDALMDVTSGTNPGCGTTGFTAVPGWDPVTGLGTPIYPKLLKVFMDLA